MLAQVCWIKNSSAAMLVAKRSVGVTIQVNLGNPLQVMKQGIHPGFEAHGRRHQKSKTGVLVSPHKGLMSSKNWKKRKYEFISQNSTYWPRRRRCISCRKKTHIDVHHSRQWLMLEGLYLIRNWLEMWMKARNPISPRCDALSLIVSQ